MVEAIVQYRTRIAGAKSSLMLSRLDPRRPANSIKFLMRKELRVVTRRSDLRIFLLIQFYHAACWAQVANKF